MYKRKSGKRPKNGCFVVIEINIKITEVYMGDAKDRSKWKVRIKVADLK